MKRNEFKSYKEAKFFMENKGIKTQREYFIWQKGKSEEYKVPANPRKFYGNEWSSWGEYLNSGNIAFQNMEFYSYEECRKIISKNNIDSKRKYLKFQKLVNLTPQYCEFCGFTILKYQFLTLSANPIGTIFGLVSACSGIQSSVLSIFPNGYHSLNSYPK